MRRHNDIELQLLTNFSYCENCKSQNPCLGGGLNPEERKLFSRAIRHRFTFKMGARIFKVENKFKYLYAIQSGAVKIQTYAYDGTNLISGFYFSGDLIGIESIGDNVYRNDAIALSTTTVCEIPFNQLEELCDSIPALRHEVMMLFAKKIRHTEQAVVHGRHLHAKLRLLRFLQYLYEQNGVSRADGSNRVLLPMSKGDIACYLGLCPESLSRALKKLEKEGVIRNRSKSIELLDTETYSELICEENRY